MSFSPLAQSVVTTKELCRRMIKMLASNERRPQFLACRPWWHVKFYAGLLSVNAFLDAGNVHASVIMSIPGPARLEPRVAGTSGIVPNPVGGKSASLFHPYIITPRAMELSDLVGREPQPGL